MILEIFSKETRERLDVIKSYSFIQVIDKFNNVGTFVIKMPFNEESIKHLKRGNYILFEKEVMGVITYLYKSTGETSLLEVKGMFLKRILSYRSFGRTKSYQGTIVEIARKMVRDSFLENSDERNIISYISINEDEIGSDLETISKQVTGGTLLDAISSMLETDSYGFNLIPKIVAYDEESDTPTNISSFVFKVIEPVDRTIGNSYGNNPVVFSVDMNNLANLLYEEDDELYCSTAIVAGEGEGSERKILEVGDQEVSGINRIELYVDARDLQSIKEDGTTMSEEEYTALLRQRGLENLDAHKLSIVFSGTIVEGNLSHTYGVDFKNGDFVSLIDEQLNIVLNTQITEVIKSKTEAGEIIDLTFGYERATLKQLLKKKGVL